MKKRIMAFVLLLSMLFGVSACGGDKPSDDTSADTPAVTSPIPTDPTDTAGESEAETTPPVPADDIDLGRANTTDLKVSTTIGGDNGPTAVQAAYTYKAGDAAFDLTEADGEGTTVTLRENTVSAVRFKKFFQDGTKASYQFKLHVTATSQSAPWNTVYIGLRLADAGHDATAQSGIWLSVRENQIGLRTNNWPETSYITTPAGVNFATARTVYIEDDMATDVVTVSADNDSGERVVIATVKLEGDAINLYRPDEDAPALTDQIQSSIQKNGYFNIWMHHMTAPAYVTDWTASGMEIGKETEKAGNMMNSRDVFSDTWVSVDDEGRVTGTDHGAVGDKKVGIFYFLWHDVPLHGGDHQIYNHAEAYKTGGVALLKETMQKGPIGFAHYWAEPYFGYYRSDDEWVIRKHTYQLTAAGVDFIFIDATNGLTYTSTYETILRVWSKMRAEGQTTPQIMFHCGDNQNVAPSSFYALWENLYSQGRYEELWFKHDGKPLIFIPRSLMRDMTAEQKEFFTVRHSWSYTRDQWYTATRGKNCWPWADMYPQNPGRSPDGEVEQMIVMSGFWVNGSYNTNAGRSYSYRNGGQPSDSNFGFDLVASGSSGKGIAFEEQFDRAIEVDPEIIMITGWNEWWAGRWTPGATGGAGAGQWGANTYTVTNNGTWSDNYYVDCFNPEFSRDIEPVKGYYNDNYYYQMAQNIREYKGSRVPLAAFGQKAIEMNGDAAQWLSVGPEYRDAIGDTAHRDADSFVGGLHYTNNTGRNDFATCKVSRDGDNIWFYAECADTITAPSGTNWMNLYINADGRQETGWYGYDYILNRSQDSKTCSIEKFVGNEWAFETVGNADFVVSGNTIVIKVSASVLGLGSTFDFKWADNSVSDGDIMQFIDLGDTAPNDRFNYRYTTEAVEVIKPEVLSDDMIVLKAGSYNAFVGGEMVMLNNQSTKATFLGDENGLYVPRAFAEGKMGLYVASAEVKNHYGVEYVDITEALEACGKTVSRTDSLLVIADQAVSGDDMRTLYRALY